MAIMQAVCLSQGTAYFGRVVNERVGSVYVVGEGKGSINARFAAAVIGATCPGKPPIAVMKRPPNLETDKGRKDFVYLLKAVDEKFRAEHGVRLGAFFMDTVAACFNIKKEDDAAEINRVCKIAIDIAEQTATVGILLQHFGKDPTRGPRGSSQWRGSAEMIVGVTADLDPMTGELIGKRGLVVMKARDDKQGPVCSWSLEKIEIGTTIIGAPITALYAKEDGPFELPTAAARVNQSLIDLTRAVTDGLQDLAVGNRTIRAVKVEDVRHDFYARQGAITRQAKSQAFRRAMRKLSDDQGFRVEEIEGVDWLCEP
jgi:AAA domain